MPPNWVQAEALNIINAEMMGITELFEGLVLAVELDELIMKGVKFNTVKMMDVNNIKKELLNK